MPKLTVLTLAGGTEDDLVVRTESPRLRQRQQHVSADTLARSWAAQLRLCRRFRQLERRKHITGVAVVAVARELAGFLWAEMQA